eukprot:1789521-Rhodomonas_salina.2
MRSSLRDTEGPVWPGHGTRDPCRIMSSATRTRSGTGVGTRWEFLSPVRGQPPRDSELGTPGTYTCTRSWYRARYLGTSAPL